MNDDIKKILECGALAPSGGNSQPWEFRLHDNVVEVIAIPKKDHRILNFRNRGTWVAHGALIENMLIAASALGYRTDLKIFPDKKGQPNLTAKMSFVKTGTHADPLYEAISHRVTNRKPYKSKPLTEVQHRTLVAAGNSMKGVSTHLIDAPDELATVGAAVSVNEIVMFENKELHGLFMKEMVWTAEEEREKGGGLFMKTMELKPPQQVALKNVFRHWPLMSTLNKVGIAKKIASGNAKVYASTAAMGAIIVEDTDEAFLDAGRVMERIWLEATRLGLGFQLTTGILFMHQRVLSGDFPGLSEKHRGAIEQAYGTIATLFKTRGTIALVFRVGEAPPPSALSIKQPPHIIQ